MLVVAVTGGIGSGKSTVAEFFRAKGVPVIDTDTIARQLVSAGQPLLQQIIAQFGREYLDKNGNLDRKALRKHVFADAQARRQLESLMHPAIHAEVMAQLQDIDAAYCLILIPLLARSQQHYGYDRVLLVQAPEAIRIERTAKRDNQDPDMIRQIIASQPAQDEMLAMTDDVLENSGDMQGLSAKVDALHAQYLKLSGTRH